MRHRRTGDPMRRGASTVEVVVCVLLMGLLVQLSWALLVAARDATGRLIRRGEALATERIGWHVISAELRAGVPVRDWGVGAGRVLPLRAFRGVGEVCGGAAAEDGALVRYRGMRLAEPEKDSLLVLTSGGTWLAVKLTSRSPSLTECPAWPGEPLERWHWEPGAPGALLARVYERGSYHLEDRAVRYRVGEAGRQPLTEERLESASAFAPGASALEIRLRVRVDERTVWDTSRPLGPLGGPPDD